MGGPILNLGGVLPNHSFNLASTSLALSFTLTKGEVIGPSERSGVTSIPGCTMMLLQIDLLSFATCA